MIPVPNGCLVAVTAGTGWRVLAPDAQALRHADQMTRPKTTGLAMPDLGDLPTSSTVAVILSRSFGGLPPKLRS